MASITHQVNFIGFTRAVAAAGGIAFVGIANGFNSKVCEVDLGSGEVLETYSFLYEVHDVVFSGNYLYVLALRAFHILEY
ncbi:MAG: hypothetical protein GKR87_14250 [Kiritimatiellae bacterium]|nr:hypothetical protein [Kiritimatiellia bacterium]NKB25508.1 hypothetical protein [Kiritimatiellia bacterium]